jgi:FkbM family methyltransferase
MRAVKKVSFLFSLIADYGLINGMKLFYIMVVPGKNKTAITFVDKIAPIFIRRGTSDIPTFKQIFIEHAYISDYTENIEYIIDCGANIGLSVRYFRYLYPNAKIAAIEPDADNYNMLKENTQFDNNILLFKNGIWNRSAHLEVVDVFNVGSWGFSVVEVSEKSEKTVPALSIKDVIVQSNFPRVDLLKVDIEGSEKEVFESDTESWLPLVNNMIIETHDKYRKGTSRAVFETMLKYDFELEVKFDSLIFKNIRKKK